MIKPTPGPYEIHDSVTKSSVGVSSQSRRRTCIATFWRDTGDDKKEQAEANARAWVEGREAVETLERIRAAMAMVAPCERAYEVRDRVLAILEGKAST